MKDIFVPDIAFLRIKGVVRKKVSLISSQPLIN